MNAELLEAIRQEILTTDWSIHSGPEGYKGEHVAETLLWLLALEKEDEAKLAWDRVVSVLGNDHAGTYFPALLPASDIMIKIERNTLNQLQKHCVAAILNNFFYFEPVVDGYDGIEESDLKNLIKEELAPYSDEGYWNGE